MSHKLITFLLLGIFCIVLFYLMKTTPSGLIPNEDTGTFFITVELSPGTSLEQTDSVMDQIDHILVSVPVLQSRTRIVGTSLIAGSGSSYGTFICRLQDWSDRKGKGGGRCEQYHRALICQDTSDQRCPYPDFCTSDDTGF